MLYLLLFISYEPRKYSLPALKWYKVACLADFDSLALLNPTYVLHTTGLEYLISIESPFLEYPTFLILADVVWWSTALWTARTAWRRKPGWLLTLRCITLVEFFFDEDATC